MNGAVVVAAHACRSMFPTPKLLGFSMECVIHFFTSILRKKKGKAAAYLTRAVVIGTQTDVILGKKSRRGKSRHWQTSSTRRKSPHDSSRNWRRGGLDYYAHHASIPEWPSCPSCCYTTRYKLPALDLPLTPSRNCLQKRVSECFSKRNNTNYQFRKIMGTKASLVE